MSNCRSCDGGAKARSRGGEEHSEADGSSGVCWKCMLQRLNADAAMFIRTVLLLLMLWGSPVRFLLARGIGGWFP